MGNKQGTLGQHMETASKTGALAFPGKVNRFYFLESNKKIKVLEKPASTSYSFPYFQNIFIDNKLLLIYRPNVTIFSSFKFWSFYCASSNLFCFVTEEILKVSKFQKQIMVSKILPKNKPNSLS